MKTNVFRLTAAVIAALSALSVADSPAQASAVAAPDYGAGEWRITSVLNSYAMDDSGSSLANGAAIVQWPVHNGVNQRWRLESTGDGYWRLRNVNSNKCLDVSGGTRADGGRLIQWDCGSGDNQRFRLPENGRGQIIAKHSGKAVDVPGSSRTAGVQLIQWAPNAGQNQQWILERVTLVTPPPSPTRPDVAAAQTLLKAMARMRAPWQQIDAPIKNNSGNRHTVYYDAVIEQFNPTLSEFAGRYKPTSAAPDTKCNIYAGDVMRAMGVPLPTKGNLGTGASGSKYTDPMTANASDLHKFLTGMLSSSDAATIGWREINPTTADGLRQLVAHVNAGKPAVASNSGHIGVVRPGQGNVSSWRDLRAAQAGGRNFLNDTLGSGFGNTTMPRFFVRD